MSARMSNRAGLALAFALAVALGGPAGCSRRTAPPPPVGLPHTMPSGEEADGVREGAGEAVPGVPERPGRTAGTPEAGRVIGGQVPGDSAAGDDAERAYGFRVQLFATANRELAESRAVEYRQIFDEAVYVDFEGLLYKVAVGDCQTRDEAQALRRVAIGAGCGDAFVVDALVKKR